MDRAKKKRLFGFFFFQNFYQKFLFFFDLLLLKSFCLNLVLHNFLHVAESKYFNLSLSSCLAKKLQFEKLS